MYKFYEMQDIVYTAGSSSASYTPSVNVDEYSSCYYRSYGYYKLNKYMQNGVVYNGNSNSWTTVTSSSRPSWITSFKDHNDLGYLNSGTFVIYLSSASY